MRKSISTNDDYFLALLNHRNTPSVGLNTSPAQRLMGRRTKTTLPSTQNQLIPMNHDCKKNVEMRETMRIKACEISSHKKDLMPLTPGDNVRMEPLVRGERQWQQGTVKEQLPNRSYIVTFRHHVPRRHESVQPLVNYATVT